MLSLNDIINISFRRSNFSGYRADDVDAFVDQVRDSYDALIKKNVEQKEQNEALQAENAQLNRKIEVLAAKIEEYRAEEDDIKNALISAQKLGDAAIRESRHKAEIILKDANLKAGRILAAAQSEAEEQSRSLDRLRKEAADFRSRLLDIYKQHLTLIHEIPVEKPAPASKPAEAQPEAAPTEEAAPAQPVEAPAAEPAADLGATREFSVEAVSFDKEEPSAPPERDLRYDVLKFGDDYSISGDFQ